MNFDQERFGLWIYYIYFIYIHFIYITLELFLIHTWLFLLYNQGSYPKLDICQEHSSFIARHLWTSTLCVLVFTITQVYISLHKTLGIVKENCWCFHSIFLLFWESYSSSGLLGMSMVICFNNEWVCIYAIREN